jgi:hypothetical protein
MSEHRHDIDPRTEAGRKLLAELPYTRDRWLADILAIEREATSPTADYGGLVAVAENAKREGFPIHVATRTTCQQHIVAGDHMRNAFAFGQSAFDAGLSLDTGHSPSCPAQKGEPCADAVCGANGVRMLLEDIIAGRARLTLNPETLARLWREEEITDLDVDCPRVEYEATANAVLQRLFGAER